MMSLEKKKGESVVYWRILIIFDGVNSFFIFENIMFI